MIRAEGAHPYYTTDVLARIFEAEADDLYDVRQAVLGHVQQGGNPSPFDRVLAARLAADVVAAVSAALGAGRSMAVAIGLDNGEIARTSLRRVDDLVELGASPPARPVVVAAACARDADLPSPPGHPAYP